jgi:hypothetical protein
MTPSQQQVIEEYLAKYHNTPAQPMKIFVGQEFYSGLVKEISSNNGSDRLDWLLTRFYKGNK